LNAGSNRLSNRSANPRIPGPAQPDRPVAPAQAARFPQAIAVATRGIDRGTALIPGPPEHFFDFHLQHPLEQLLHALPRESFQGLPGRA